MKKQSKVYTVSVKVSEPTLKKLKKRSKKTKKSRSYIINKMLEEKSW